MTFKAYLNIMPHPELLDPQGKAVAGSMKHLKLGNISDVRIGKRIELTLSAGSEEEAGSLVQQACEKLLANQIMEHFEYRIERQVEEPAV